MRKTNLFYASSEVNPFAILKKYILLLVLTSFSFGALANHSLASIKHIKMYNKSKTCVVLEDNSIWSNAYNSFIKDAVEKYWKSTQYEFIDQTEFNKRRFDPKYSFLVLMNVAFDKDPEGISYKYINLVLGDTAKNITNMPELCSIPISYSNDNNINFGYAVPAIVKFMQKHVKKLEKRHFCISLKGLKYYNCGAKFKDKTLLLNKVTLAAEANTPEKIKDVYPYNIKLLTTAEIETELIANPSNTLFNFHIGAIPNSAAGKCFEIIFDADGNLYYYNFRNITNENKDGFNLKDFKHIR